MAHLGQCVEKHVLRMPRGDRSHSEKLQRELAPAQSPKVNRDDAIRSLDCNDCAVVNVLGTDVTNKIWRAHSVISSAT